MALTDTFAALTRYRPYRGRLPMEVALEEIAFHAGSQFDPHLTELFLNMITSRDPH